MLCEQCGGADLRVTDTRDRDAHTCKRRRECRACGHRWATLEIPIDHLDEQATLDGPHLNELLRACDPARLVRVIEEAARLLDQRLVELTKTHKGVKTYKTRKTLAG